MNLKSHKEGIKEMLSIKKDVSTEGFLEDIKTTFFSLKITFALTLQNTASFKIF